VRQTVPEWLLTVLWFIAGIGATGAFWYFLSMRNYAAAVAAGIATITVIVLIVSIHVRNDRLRKLAAAQSHFIGYGCLLTKFAEHEYFRDESHKRDQSQDPWVIHRRVRSELMALIGELRGDPGALDS
jgi:hypothetical protein